MINAGSTVRVHLKQAKHPKATEVLAGFADCSCWDCVVDRGGVRVGNRDGSHDGIGSGPEAVQVGDPFVGPVRMAFELVQKTLPTVSRYPNQRFTPAGCDSTEGCL